MIDNYDPSGVPVKEANMAELASMLRTPVFRAALEVIKEESLTYLPDPMPGVDYRAHVAALGAQAIGWARAIHALESLAIRPMRSRQTHGTTI